MPAPIMPCCGLGPAMPSSVSQKSPALSVSDPPRPSSSALLLRLPLASSSADSPDGGVLVSHVGEPSPLERVSPWARFRAGAVTGTCKLWSAPCAFLLLTPPPPALACCCWSACCCCCFCRFFCTCILMRSLALMVAGSGCASAAAGCAATLTADIWGAIVLPSPSPPPAAPFPPCPCAPPAEVVERFGAVSGDLGPRHQPR
mmetsp:Transcript_21811/g.55091  ORF Transcript_21811/g.55091 Transcript_21811/m.55091 type:complete len:202 (-) Transcript_21811:213-818(-)